VARLWRTPLGGELAMGLGTPLLRRALPAATRDDVLRHWDHGTQRAILRLYRSAPPAALERAGARLEAVRAPALVLWGERDPYIAPRFGEELARRLGGTCEVVSDAGHWPWLERPDLRDRITAFAAD
jgi:pimeloyl-ACP methyl ester carboxylesterase